MSKDNQMTEQVEDTVTNVTSTVEQAVDSEQEFAKDAAKPTASQASKKAEAKEDLKMEEKTVVVQKSGGKGLAFLALLVALGIGGAGYYFGTQKLTDVETKIQALAATAGQTVEGEKFELPDFEAEKTQIAELTANYEKALERINLLEKARATDADLVAGMQAQVQKLSGMPQSDAVLWKLSDADFLLNNAVRKLVLDNDIDTTKNLLTEADEVLAQVSNTQVENVRAAIKADLNQLASVNQVDQNSLMLRLTTLANHLDDLPMLANETEEPSAATSGEISDSIQDWQQNIEKSASSFLDHFIRISDRNKANSKVFVAPDQEIYLRENIRLRLQIAILAIPRQQNELYKQSLEAVSTWIRSYFDTQNENVKNFLKELDDLTEQSVYVDAPESLQSLVLLEQLLNKVPQAVEKIEIKAEKALQPVQTEAPKTETESPAAETPPKAAPQSTQPAEQPAAQ